MQNCSIQINIQNTEPLDAEIEEAGKPLSGDL